MIRRVNFNFKKNRFKIDEIIWYMISEIKLCSKIKVTFQVFNRKIMTFPFTDI